MEDSDESWEQAEMDVFNIQKSAKNIIKLKEKMQNARLLLLHRILLAVELLKKPKEIIKLNEQLNTFDKFNLIIAYYMQKKDHSVISHIDSVYKWNGLFTCHSNKFIASTDYEQEILIFLAMNLNKIPCRIYFSIGPKIHVFHEYAINSKILEHKNKYPGNCFSIDIFGSIVDQSYIFSKEQSYYAFFTKILESVSKRLEVLKQFYQNDYFSDSFIQLFAEIDQTRKKIIPTSINLLKFHPLYVAESLCKYNEFIYPKRPICGLINGIPIYPRENIKKLKTSFSWLKQGRLLIDNEAKPYRIYKDKFMYAEFQTKPAEIEDITGKPMLAYHENLNPKNCVRIYYDPNICKELGVKYSDSLVGFRGDEKITNGFFIKKKDCFLVNFFIKEQEYHKYIYNELLCLEQTFHEWQKLIKKCKKYISIKNRIDKYSNEYLQHNQDG